VGSRCGPFAPALAMLADGRLDVSDLVEARYPLADGLAAFAKAAAPGVLKVLLEA
jgi:threonine dehydrogenase-like Zn-dependent dehydrogenase